VAKEEMVKLSGKVDECLPGAMFRVILENNHKILAYVGGKMRKHSINISLGDSVDVELSAYDMTKGRIVFRTR
jgi:translation initiation factor IF-1